jgi:flagellar motor switch protein FliN/FliY
VATLTESSDLHTSPAAVPTHAAHGRPNQPADDLGRLLRLQVPVIVKLAHRRMRLGEIMRLSVGTIVEFAKPAEEPLDLLVSNVVIGQGDVVKVGENYGLRVTRIGKPAETIRALGGATAPAAPDFQTPDLAAANPPIPAGPST